MSMTAKPHIYLSNNGYWYVTTHPQPYKFRSGKDTKLWNAAYKWIALANWKTTEGVTKRFTRNPLAILGDY